MRRPLVSLVLLAVAALAGCSQASSPALPPAGGSAQGLAGSDRAPDRVGYALLYSFQNGTDGTGPRAPLVAVGKAFYGTTYYGGADGAGAVVVVSRAGAERVLYSFRGGSDGANPSGPVLYFRGQLWGTTTGGGTGSTGTVYTVSLTGHERVAYSFGGVDGTDAAGPMGGLVALRGTLYGTSITGGTNADGTVFAVSPSGQEHVVYNFGGPPDAYSPEAGLAYAGGLLYGTAYYGGSANIGAVFSVNPQTGAEKVVYSFLGGSDGALPLAPLVAAGNTLYGTTANGGCTTQCGNPSACQAAESGGCGTVFSVTVAGKERVLHRFEDSFKDGATPVAGLTLVKSELYGTASIGGGTGNGAVFEMLATGKREALLYSFRGGPSDGATPQAGLLSLDGSLYGTTNGGGASFDGTVFKVTP